MGQIFGSECADRHVISVGIAKGELASLSVRVHVGFFFEARDESACSLECLIEIVHTEEEQESVAGGRAFWAGQRGMIVIAPAMKAEQDGPVGIEDLAEVIVGRAAVSVAEQ